MRLRQHLLGFSFTTFWTGAITLPTTQYPDQGSRQRFVERMLTRAARHSGRKSATVSSDIPLNWGESNAVRPRRSRTAAGGTPGHCAKS